VGAEAPFTQANSTPVGDPTPSSNALSPPTTSQPVILQFPICVNDGVELTKQNEPKAKRYPSRELPHSVRKSKRRRAVPKTSWQRFRDALDSDVSTDNDASSSEKEPSIGLYLQSAPLYPTRYIRDLCWDRLHQPAFSPSYWSEEPVQQPLDYSSFFHPRFWFLFLKAGIDEWLRPGCARMTTRAL
jgi:hypothetical protein